MPLNKGRRLDPHLWVYGHLLLWGVLTFCVVNLSCRKSAPTQPPVGIDSTSHAFIWQVDTIGAEGSYLYDVCIINDTLAYAVGQLYSRDSNGASDVGHPYNAAVWNGEHWTMIRVPYVYQGQASYSPIYSVFGRRANDVWFAFGNVVHWDGMYFSQPLVFPGFQSTGNKTWESPDGQSVYVVGLNGQIAYYDGNSPQLIRTNTTLPFQDIWGSQSSNGQQQVLAIASDKFSLGGKYIVSLSGNTFTHLADSVGTAVSLSGIWFVLNQRYFLVGDGIFEKSSLTNPIWELDPLTNQILGYPYAVRGNGVNDVVVAGELGDIAHYNGSTWLDYAQLRNSTDRLVGVSIKGDQIIAVGGRYIDGLHNYALISHGRR